MSAVGDIGAPLFGESVSTRKSATHGEAGYARVARDAYFTEHWVTQALLDAVEFDRTRLVWEPAVGAGWMADVIRRAGYSVVGSDIHDYGWDGTYIADFTYLRKSPFAEDVGAIITNPPFDKAKEFINRALYLTHFEDGKVAILQRHEFDAPKSNRRLFEPPFAAKLILPRRPRWSDSDKASPRFPYAWYVWDWRHEGPPIIRWINEARA